MEVTLDTGRPTDGQDTLALLLCLCEVTLDTGRPTDGQDTLALLLCLGEVTLDTGTDGRHISPAVMSW